MASQIDMEADWQKGSRHSLNKIVLSSEIALCTWKPSHTLTNQFFSTGEVGNGYVMLRKWDMLLIS